MKKHELLQLAPEHKELSLDFINHTLLSFYNFDNSLLYNSANSDNISCSNSDFRFFFRFKDNLIYHILIAPRYINANFEYYAFKDDFKIKIKTFEDSGLNRAVSDDFLSIMKKNNLFIFNEKFKQELLLLSEIFLRYKYSENLSDSVWNMNCIQDDIDTFTLLHDM